VTLRPGEQRLLQRGQDKARLSYIIKANRTRKKKEGRNSKERQLTKTMGEDVKPGGRGASYSGKMTRADYFSQHKGDEEKPGGTMRPVWAEAYQEGGLSDFPEEIRLDEGRGNHLLVDDLWKNRCRGILMRRGAKRKVKQVVASLEGEGRRDYFFL